MCDMNKLGYGILSGFLGVVLGFFLHDILTNYPHTVLSAFWAWVISPQLLPQAAARRLVPFFLGFGLGLMWLLPKTSPKASTAFFGQDVRASTGSQNPGSSDPYFRELMRSWENKNRG